MLVKKIMLMCSLALVITLGLSACGSDSKKSEDSKDKKDKSTKASSSGKDSDFAKQVAAVCKDVDEDKFDFFDTNDPDAFNDMLAEAEEELDNAISEFEDLDPPSKHRDDWETFLDDFSAIRDAFPEMGDQLAEYLRISNELKSTSDPATISALQAELVDVQEEIEILTDDLDQRGEEIEDIADKLGIQEACGFE